MADYNRFAYTRSNPLKYQDPTGHWVETAWDIANIAWDIHEVRKDPSAGNVAALILDVGATLLPFIPAGAGVVARGGKTATKAAKLMTHGGKTADALQAANRLRTVGATSAEGISLIKKIAELSTNGPVKATGNTVVLGRFKAMNGFSGYIDKAKAMDAVYFNTPGDDVWDALDNPWLVNRQFLDDAMARSDRFFIEADIPATLADPNHSWLQDELKHLISNGYVQDGSYMVKP